MSNLKKTALVGLVGLAGAYYLKQKLSYPLIKDLKGKTVLVTGAAGGVGREICLEIARQKEVTTIVLWDILKEEMEKTADLIKKENSAIKIITTVVNLANRDDIYKAANQCIVALGNRSPYLVINNAGIIGGVGALETPDERIELETKINCLAHVWVVKAFIPTMVSKEHGQEGGHFMNILTFGTYIASGDMTTYAMSKKGAKGFAEGLNSELKIKKLDHLVKISVLCPAHIDTKLFSGFDGGNTLKAGYVAKEVIEAVKRERQLTVLPKNLSKHVILIGISEYLGNLNLPGIDSNFNPMKGWNPNQATNIFNRMDSGNKK